MLAMTTAIPSSPTIPTITPLNYLLFLTICLVLYLLFLLLPRGLRYHYCGAARRYRRQSSGARLIWKQFTLSSHRIDSIRENTTQEFTTPRLGADPYWQTPNSIQSAPEHITGFGRWASDSFRGSPRSNGHSEIHPINENNLQKFLLQPPGIKIIAHGTKCNPRPVWITLHYFQTQAIPTHVPPEYQNCLTWRAELRPSNELTAAKLGSLRKVSFSDILGIHRGKVTTALRRVQTAQGVNGEECFSLLTKSGTLDLQCCGVDDVEAVEVRETFISLLGRALGLRGLKLNEPVMTGVFVAGQNSNSSGAGYASAYADAPKSQNSMVVNGNTSLVSGDANLSVVSF